MVWIFMIWLLVISTMDAKDCRVPVWLLAVGVGFVSVVAFGKCILGMKEYGDMAYGMLPGIFLLLMAVFTRMVGYADGTVLICLGAMCGIDSAVMTLAVGLVLSAIYSAIMLVRKKVGRKSQIPFLPFLSAAWVLTSTI